MVRQYGAGVLAAALLLSACGSSPPAPKKVFETLLNIVIVDQSESFDYAKFSAGDLEHLLQQDAQGHETWAAIVPIWGENSIEQPLQLEGPLLLDTMSVDGYSIYQRPKVEQDNQRIKDIYADRLSLIMAAYSAAISKQDRELSDINGALKFAQRLARQKRFAETQIRVIILSDLDHDLGDGSELGVFEFPANTTVYPVGLNKDLNLDEIFPSNPVELMVGLRAAFFTDSR